ncbi:MAG: type II CAAX endopeptidase family protein [Bacteroidota bacterium]
MNWEHALAFTFAIVVIRRLLRVTFGSFFYSITGHAVETVIAFGLPALIGFAIFKSYRGVFFNRSPVTEKFVIRSVFLVAILCLFALTLDAIEEVILDGFAKFPFGYGKEMLSSLISALVVAPVIEELFFRGFLLPGLMRSNSRLTSIAITTFIFLLFHLPATILTGKGIFISGPISAVLFSLLLSWLMTIHNNIRVSILLHFIWNLSCYVIPIIISLTRLPLNNPMVFVIFTCVVLVVCAIVVVRMTKGLSSFRKT